MSAHQRLARSPSAAGRLWYASLYWLLVIAIPGAAAGDVQPPGWVVHPATNESVRWTRTEAGVRVCVIAPHPQTGRPRRLVIYATPNGNTIEQTLGCTPGEGRDWRFDIQHVAAQIRRLRECAPEQDVVLAVVEAPQLSWPAFRRSEARAANLIRELVESLTREFHAQQVDLSGHSGGGSFLFGYIESVPSIPEVIGRVIFLDANYSYSDAAGHADKLLSWLRGDNTRRLIVIAYDDREIELDGRKVVGPDGGTWRASQRMLTRLRQELDVQERTRPPFLQYTALNDQIEFSLHPNPDNRILHTALVGEMNGLLHALLLATPHAAEWGVLGGPRAYTAWVRPEPIVEPKVRRATVVSDAEPVRLSLPPRPADARSGSALADALAALPRDEREAVILREVTGGNVPEFLRRMVSLRVSIQTDDGQEHSGVYHLLPDVLAVGNDSDFLRLPMTPQTAEGIADAAGACLITRKIADDVHSAAAIRLEPRPLTKDRESVATFRQHHSIIESQWPGGDRTQLVAGHKKDVVLTNRLRERTHRVALYGWHSLEGRPIQPLYVGHVDWYVDYSHGIRLMAGEMLVDGERRNVRDVLRDPQLCRLLSDEGPIDVDGILAASGRPGRKSAP